MDNLEDRMQAVLNDPETMAKIMSMAQSLGVTSPESAKNPETSGQFPDIDMGMLRKLSGLATQGNIDPQQKNLLQALNPYLSRQRIQKLENAMRAAKMASFAATALGGIGPKLSTGR